MSHDKARPQGATSTVNDAQYKHVLRKGLGDNPGLAWLFIALLFFLLSYPLLAHHPAGSLVLDVLFSAMLIISTYVFSHQRKVLIAALAIAVPTLILWWSTRVVGSTPLVLSGLVFSALFFLFVVIVLLANIMKSREVNVDTIYGAMSAYLLIGVTWSFFYAMVQLSAPGAFDFGALILQLDESSSHGPLRLFGYYSLVTLSTLGYGDITPVTPLARSLSALEAVTGQLYMAVLIARLVGMHIAQQHNR